MATRSRWAWSRVWPSQAGNLTGLAILTDELELKKLQLLKETAPRVTRVAVLSNPNNPVWPRALKRLQEGGTDAGCEDFSLLEARDSGDLEAAFAAATKEKAGALQVVADQAPLADSQRIVDFAAMRRLPSMYSAPRYVREGGLMSYGVPFNDMIRRAAAFVDKILKGAKPGDLPIEQPIKFELIINLKTAKALGLTISPPSLLARADQVIE